jgi:hypothetical protein
MVGEAVSLINDKDMVHTLAAKRSSWLVHAVGNQ